MNTDPVSLKTQGLVAVSHGTVVAVTRKGTESDATLVGVPGLLPYKPGEPSAKAYIVVPSTVEAYLAEADPLAYYRAMADTLRKVGHVNVSIPARGVRKGCSDCFIKEYNHDGPKVPPFELAYAVVAHGRQQFAPVRLEYDDLVAWLERLGARWVTTP